MTQICDQDYPRTYCRSDPAKGLAEVYVVSSAGIVPRPQIEVGRLGRPSAIYRSEESLQRAGYVLESLEEDAAGAG